MNTDNLQLDVRRSLWVKELIRIARNICDKHGSPQFYVRRGAIDWTSFKWPKDSALAIRVPEVFPYSVSFDSRVATLEITAACRVPVGEENIDDDRQDWLEDQVILILQTLQQQVKQNGDSYVIKIDHVGSVEFNDIEYRVQGYHVTFSIEY